MRSAIPREEGRSVRRPRVLSRLCHGPTMCRKQRYVGLLSGPMFCSTVCASRFFQWVPRSSLRLVRSHWHHGDMSPMQPALPLHSAGVGFPPGWVEGRAPHGNPAPPPPPSSPSISLRLPPRVRAAALPVSCWASASAVRGGPPRRAQRPPPVTRSMHAQGHTAAPAAAVVDGTPSIHPNDRRARGGTARTSPLGMARGADAAKARSRSRPPRHPRTPGAASARTGGHAAPAPPARGASGL